MRTRVKFCGMTRPGDVRLACELGVDAVGVVFAHRSPRRVDIGHAASLRAAVAPLVGVVALFMDNAVDEIESAIRALRPTLLQFHGSEDDAACRRFGLPYFKSIGMQAADGAGDLDLDATFARYPNAAGFVLDGHAPGAPGGGGRTFDWSQRPDDGDRPWLLAGGLGPHNVGAAIVQARPWGVDVSSGIETSAIGTRAIGTRGIDLDRIGAGGGGKTRHTSSSDVAADPADAGIGTAPASVPGIKDGERMRRFIHEVLRHDALHVDARAA